MVTKDDMRIIYMGTPEFAVFPLKRLIENKYNVVAVVTSVDKPAGRGQKISYSPVKECALSYNIPVLQPENLKDPKFINELETYKADLQIVVAFRMLPKIVWSMPIRGTFNLHASLLPQYRGASPINYAILNGEKETGVTTFFIDENIDTGKIIFQEIVDIDEKDTFGTLHDKLMKTGSELVVKTTEAILNIHNHVRAFNPIPGAWTTLVTIDEKEILKIFSTSYEIEAHFLNPGVIKTDSKTYIKIATFDGFIFINELQPAGKSKMSVKDFLNGYKIEKEAVML